MLPCRNSSFLPCQLCHTLPRMLGLFAVIATRLLLRVSCGLWSVCGWSCPSVEGLVCGSWEVAALLCCAVVPCGGWLSCTIQVSDARVIHTCYFHAFA
jgi:hypothetical protein